MQQYNELSSWLGTVLQKAKRQSSCLSEKYVNQVETVLHVVSIAWLLLRQLTLKLLYIVTEYAWFPLLVDPPEHVLV